MEVVLAGVHDSSAVSVQVYPAAVWNDGQPIFYQRHMFISKNRLMDPTFLSLLSAAAKDFDSIADGSRYKPYFQVANQLKISRRNAMIFMAAASVAYPDKYELLAQPSSWKDEGPVYAASLRMAVIGTKIYPMLRSKFPLSSPRRNQDGADGARFGLLFS